MTGEELGGVEFEVAAPFDRRRSAWILCGKKRLGIVGEFKQAVRRNFKLPEYAAGFSIDFDQLLAQPRDKTNLSAAEPFSINEPRCVAAGTARRIVC